MNDAGYDFAVFGSNPLACLLAGLLAGVHRKRICLVGTVWSPFHMPRRFDLSAMPATRPETWVMLQRGSVETLKLLGGIGRGLFERGDALFVGESPASSDMLGHMRHVASGLGIAAERASDRSLLAAGSGCLIRDVAMLVTGRIEPALDGWLETMGVRRLPERETAVTLRRDGSAILVTGEAPHLEARHAVLADAGAMLRHLDTGAIDGALRRQAMTSVVTEPTRSLGIPFVHFLDRGVALGQRGGKGAITAIAEGREELLPRIGSCLAAQVPLLRAGQTAFEELTSTDGAPLVGPAHKPRATVIAGLGSGGAFLAPALARHLAGVAEPAERDYFIARRPARSVRRQQVADWGRPRATEHTA